MTRAAWLLAWRSLADRPWRSALLLLGYGIGVAVMIALLSVGQALLSQARDPDLAAGGDLVLLPQGVDPSVLKVNGVTGLYFSIPHASFVVRDVLAGPRFAGEVAAAAPQMRSRQVYARAGGRAVLAAASAGIPSLDRRVRVPEAVPGARDSAADRAWLHPTVDALDNRIDRFHRPPAARRAAWAEWDYFTFYDPAANTYGYLTLLAGGEGKGAVLLRLRRPDRPVEDVALAVPVRPGGLSLMSATQTIGPARVWVRAGAYHVVVHDPRLSADLRLVPAAGLYLPPAEAADSALISGYVVPVVRGRMSGEIRTGRTHLRLADVPAYHDHNWGTWRGVTWEWGEGSGAGGALLYGAVRGAGTTRAADRPAVLFLWGPAGAGRSGLLGVFAVDRVVYAGWHAGPVIRGRRVPAPRRIALDATAGDDRVHVRAEVWDALASAPEAANARPGVRAPREHASLRVFLQLRTVDRVWGTVGGRPVAWTGRGASETFVEVAPGLTP